MPLAPELPQNIKDLINDLIKELDIKEVNNNLLKEYNKNDLWKYLLEYMKQENEDWALGHYPILSSDFPQSEITSLFEYINKYIDLDNNIDYNFSTIINNLKEKINNEDGTLDQKYKNSGDYPWNESLTNSLTHFIRYFNQNYINNYEHKNSIKYKSDIDDTNQPLEVEHTHGSIPAGDLKGGFRMADIKNANAGNSFKRPPLPPPGFKAGARSWVRPNYNID